MRAREARCKYCEADFITTNHLTVCPECWRMRNRFERLSKKIPFGLTPPQWEEFQELKAFFNACKERDKKRLHAEVRKFEWLRKQLLEIREKDEELFIQECYKHGYEPYRIIKGICY